MFTIAGATGQVGSAVATELLAAGRQVKVLVRSRSKGQYWTSRGAEAAVVDLGDRAGLADALRGSHGAFVLLPFDLSVDDVEDHQRRVAASIADAVQEATVPHVAMLSSLGADLADGPRLTQWLGALEARLRSTGTTLSAVRSGHFQEKVRDLLGAARAAGVYPVFGESADVPVPMVATRDVGAVVAETLQARPTASQVIDVQGPGYPERYVADRLSAVLGRPLEVITIPREGWVDALVGAGLPAFAAKLLAELYAADSDGLLLPSGDRQVRGDTPIEETLRHLLGAY